ncbi:MAG: iron-containing alcohol dehydrogenase [Gammaproteobacteria bacterium]|nr:iron-containing alcohol dehydrogenase [Gammaproteobacteria bacterium]NNC97226.1 iron-containing alcohol dehydrogenase [Gammaproteobacteria bacterium]NNM13385.1 iron-containing alcohol dehydrogenase [Gammaproteobacteria bacterium]
MKSFLFSTVPDTHVGPGSVSKLGDIADELNLKNLLLVSDPGIQKAGLLEVALTSLASKNITVSLFVDVEADPSDKIIQQGFEQLKRDNCDGVIGLGGGSSMDVAKVIAVLAKEQQVLAEIYGVDNIRSGRLPLIQIPTTAGTGSEATMVSVVTTGETTKSGVVSRSLLGDAIILDPELTLGLPAHITAATGIDAMVHAIESFTSVRLKNPISDMLAKEALRLLSGSIRVAVKDGSNVKARSDMLLGAMYAGQAFANAPVAAVHALAYPLGGYYHIPHGLSNSLVLPHVLRFNGRDADDLYAELVPCISDCQPNSAEHVSQPAEMMAEYFLELAKDLGIPTTLQAMNIEKGDLDMLAEAGMQQQRLLINNPREVSYADAQAIYNAAY